MNNHDLSIEIFDRQTGFNFLSHGIIDDFKSCIVNWNAYSFNTFQLTLSVATDYLLYFRENNIFSISDCYFYIDNIKYDSTQSELMTITGKSLFGKGYKRIVMPPYSTNSAKPEKIIYDLIDKTMITTSSDNKLPYLAVQSPPDYGLVALSYQNSYGTVSDEITSLADSNQICIREVQTNLQNPAQEIQLYRGRDLSGDGGIEFSLKDDGLKSEAFVRDISDQATVAHVFGEGEGAARKYVKVTRLPSNYDSLDVCEIYVDARDLQQSYTTDSGQTVTLTDAQYKAQLTQRGVQALAERVEVLQLSGEVNFNNLNFRYGIDYEVGDTVRVKSDKFGISKTSVLTSMQETWDETGYHLDPTFDKDSATLIQKLKRK